MLEWRLSAEALQSLEGLQPDLLNDILHLALAPGIAAGRCENPWRIFLNQRLKARSIPFQHPRDQLRLGQFHPADYVTPNRGLKEESHCLATVAFHPVTTKNQTRNYQTESPPINRRQLNIER